MKITKNNISNKINNIPNKIPNKIMNFLILLDKYADVHCLGVFIACEILMPILFITQNIPLFIVLFIINTEAVHRLEAIVESQISNK